MKKITQKLLDAHSILFTMLRVDNASRGVPLEGLCFAMVETWKASFGSAELENRRHGQNFAPCEAEAGNSGLRPSLVAGGWQASGRAENSSVSREVRVRSRVDSGQTGSGQTGSCEAGSFSRIVNSLPDLKGRWNRFRSWLLAVARWQGKGDVSASRRGGPAVRSGLVGRGLSGQVRADWLSRQCLALRLSVCSLRLVAVSVRR